MEQENCLDCGTDISKKYGFVEGELQLCSGCFAHRVKANTACQKKLLSLFRTKPNYKNKPNFSKKIPAVHATKIIKKIEKRIAFQEQLTKLIELNRRF